ncbi:MAG: histidine kinase dimerization/phospho-acceptor domain-containing protein [Longimicrobiales bacterium]
MNAPGSAITQWQIDAIRYAVLSRLADDLAHEIKNPLNSMVINLEVLRNRVEKGATDPALERAAVLDHEIRRLHTLVDGLLRLLRPPQSDAAATTSMSLVLEELQPLLQLRARLAHVEMRVDGLAVDAFTPISADLLRFGLLAVAEQVLDLARQSATPMWLTAEAQAGEIHVHLGWASDSISARVADWLSDEDPAALRGIPAAMVLLEPAGCRIEMQSAGAAGTGSDILIRVPRMQYL